MQRTWRLHGISESYQIARRHDIPAAVDAQVNPHLAWLYIDRWLADPHTRQNMVEIYESISGIPVVVGRWTRGYDLHGRIKSRLVEAFQRGDLVIMRAPHVGNVPVAARKPETVAEPEGAVAEIQPAREEEIYVIATEVRTIGDTVLANHKVRIIDPDTGKAVGSPKMTDENGVVRAVVPENKNYRIEILDEDAIPQSPPPLPADYPQGVLICHFVDEAGNPITNEQVEVSSGDDRFDVITDADGRIEAPALLAAYDVEVRGETFTAHPLLWKDREDEENVYRFIVGTADSQDEGAEASSRLTEYVDLAGEEEGDP